MVGGASETLPAKVYLSNRLRWLTLLRVVFTTALLASTVIVQFKTRELLISPPILVCYGLIGTVYILTFFYVLLFKRLGSTVEFAYVQISLDTLFVTLLIYVTGGIASVFSFLYLVVIIYASIILYKKGSLIMATLCSIQYGVMVGLEYYGVLAHFYAQAGLHIQSYNTPFLIYKTILTMVACFLVAFLSSHLVQQAVNTEKELQAKQKDLQELEAFNANIIHSMNSGLLTLDVAGSITSFNPAAEVITGFKGHEVLGKPLANIFPEIVKHYSFSIAPSEKRAYRHDVTFRKRDGTIGYLGFSVSSLREPDGKIIGSLLIFQDLTALRAMEAHVKKVEELAAVGEMAAGIAHEIKNPLASMTGSIQLLEGQIDMTPARGKLMQIVLREADRLNTLANDFLVFARPGSGAAEPVDVSSVIEETLRLFRQDTVCRNTITLKQRLAPNLWARMDPSHMRQIIWNLLLNAAEAVNGAGAIEVVAKVSQNLVEVAVKDDGCGMSEQTRKQIFNPFFTTRAQGTGLGLSIVHRLLESYGGRIDVQSRQGHGTTFIMHLERIGPPGRAMS